MTEQVTIDLLVNQSILSINNPTAGFKNQMVLYGQKIAAIAKEDAEHAVELIQFWRVLIKNKFTGFFDVEDKIYHSSVGLNQSSLKDFKRSQGKYFYNRYVEPKVYKSKAIDEGNLIHDLLLRPENIVNYYNDAELCKWAEDAYEDEKGKRAGKIRSTSIYKEQKAEIEKEGKTLISGDLFNKLDLLKKEIIENPFFKNLLHGAMIEKAMYSICKHTGLLIRGKCDAISKDGYILDLKTIDENFSLDPEAIGRHMFNLGQYLQAPHYENLYESLLGSKCKAFLYGHIERRGPFETNIGPLDEGAADKAEQDYFDLLADARDAYGGNFPKKKKEVKINAICFPHWVFNQAV